MRVFSDWEHHISATMICLHTKSQESEIISMVYIYLFIWSGVYGYNRWTASNCVSSLSTILSGQELPPVSSGPTWGPCTVHVGPRTVHAGSHVGPVYCSCGSHVLFRWGPRGPTYYLGGAHIIFKFNSMLPSLPTLPFFIFMFFSFLILIIDIQKVICNTILIFSHTSQR